MPVEVTVSATHVEYRRASEFGSSIIRIKIDCGDPQICAYSESVDLLDNYILRPSYLTLSEIRTYLDDAASRIRERQSKLMSSAGAEPPSSEGKNSFPSSSKS